MSEAPKGLRVDVRRLAAILASDIAGCSRLMRRNEGETVRELKRVQRCVGKEGPLMDAKAACALLDSECRERVDLTRSPAVEDRYLRSPDDPSR